MGLVIIDNNKIMNYQVSYVNYYDPSMCFFRRSTNFKVLVKEGSYVYKNDPIMVNKEKSYIYSSISGIVKSYDKETKTLTIENDYKELRRKRSGVEKIKTKYNKEKLIELLKEKNISLYKDIDDNCNNLIINAIITEPYELTNKYLINNNTIMILETISALVHTFECKKGIIILSSNYGEVVNKVLDNMGSFPNIEIKVITPYYPLNNNIFLRKYLGIKKNKANMFVSLNNIYKTGILLRKNCAVTEKLVTFTGSLVKESKVINCKIGSSLNEIINEHIELKSIKKANYLLNGYMHGRIIDRTNYFIDETTHLIVIDEIETKEELDCINCGMCSDNCPLKLNPKYITKNNTSKCLKCGLCNYVCPAHRKIMQESGEQNE